METDSNLRFFTQEVNIMGIDYASLKKGGFMRQKQKGYFFPPPSSCRRNTDNRKFTDYSGSR